MTAWLQWHHGRQPQSRCPSTAGRDSRPPALALTWAEVTYSGATINHIIQHVDPETTADAEHFCTLLMADADGVGVVVGRRGSCFPGWRVYACPDGEGD